MKINEKGNKVVEICVLTGKVLNVSRRNNNRINIFYLQEKDYVETQDVGDKILYRWKDQFPVQVKWENTNNVRVYEPGSVMHVVTKKQ